MIKIPSDQVFKLGQTYRIGDEKSLQEKSNGEEEEVKEIGEEQEEKVCIKAEQEEFADSLPVVGIVN